MPDSGTVVGKFVQVGGDSLDEGYPGGVELLLSRSSRVLDSV